MEEGKDSVRGLRVIVVGAANGVGRAIAEAYATGGARVRACDIDVQALASLSGARQSATVHRMNACVAAEVRSVLQEVLREDAGVDVLVNTVGLPGPRALLENVEDTEWEATLAGSVGAAFYCIREVIPWMKRQRSGCIINFSSCSTKTGLPFRTPYIVSKYAVEGLTRNLARELGPFNIRVNAILPGAIDGARLSGMLARAATDKGVSQDEIEASMLRYISMRRKISADEIAAAVLFLSSPAAPQITGQLLSVDGNMEWEE